MKNPFAATRHPGVDTGGTGRWWCHATGETVLGPGDAVVVAGAVRAVERFAALTRR